ncbi:hypothetical protein BFW01_g4547 [Lasiodiplodia theobromae]|uniref:RxLR effector protein n=2 Tax=Lasiodiplodia TaxID=66739 RepID=A0A5N5DJ03_9PEZI|nr:uncharacterized protein LTHEOB_11673 [Lasiodiplodia theobromae]KAB2577845.1 hypothetical protein DBV05_g3488 [Lasiodiplodia theobromae]KAF4537124.1 hypothetical protein LTHEOB_11673 [Lasiodiplodia theobromae]KAF9633653.1 hypothetical protein BFW01_g4547 [Lasiodiplodia theobromae]KAK0661021.1 hypothetical protein DIS24_g2886 [Lasiodiplodia hormozganensis]
MRFTTTSLARLITAFFLIAFVTAAPVAVTTSSTGLSAAGQEGGARIAERDLSSSPIVDTDVAAAEAKKREFSSTMWALKDRLLMKRQPKPEPAAEPKRFTLDDFTTIAAANEKYDGLRPEGAGFVGLKQRGLPGWSRIY